MENKADVPKVSFLSFLGLTRKSKYIIESFDKNSSLSLSVIPVLAFCHFHAFFFLSFPCFLFFCHFHAFFFFVIAVLDTAIYPHGLSGQAG